MAADECRRFEQDPDGDDLVALRRADDDAKERGKVVPGLDRWRAVIERVVRDG
jgi:predicted HD phosphohydrolase